jgi:hypothetical protein
MCSGLGSIPSTAKKKGDVRTGINKTAKYLRSLGTRVRKKSGVHDHKGDREVIKSDKTPEGESVE